MKTKKEIRTDYANSGIATVVDNGNTLTVTNVYEISAGHYRFDGSINGEQFERKSYSHFAGMLETGKVNVRTSKRSKSSTVVPKTQKVEITANNKDVNVTLRFKKGGDIERIHKIADTKIDVLRAQQQRIEREIDLLLTFASYKSFAKESAVLQAREESVTNRRRIIDARITRLQSYIDTYAKRVGDVMLLGNIEKAQMLVATKDARLKRAQELIAELSK